MKRFIMTFTLLLACLPDSSHAAKAWTSFIRPYRYNDLWAEGDTVWCATVEAGLLRFLTSTRTFEATVREPGGLASNHLTSLTLDRSRRLWVGTQGAGASVLSADRKTWRLVNAFDGLPSDSVTALQAVGDTLWIGTSHGLAFWDGDEVAGALPDGANPSPFASDFVTGIEVMRDTLWVATSDGMYRTRISVLLSGAPGAWSRVSAGFVHARVRATASNDSTIFALDSVTVRRYDHPTNSWVSVTGALGFVQGIFDDRGTVVAASGRGIYTWNGAAWDTVTNTLVSLGDSRRNFARDFVAGLDEQGRIVAASQTGLSLQPSRGDRGPWPSYVPSGPPGNDIRNLVIDRSRLYIGTEDEGIGRYDGAAWKYWFPPAVPLVNESDSTFRRPQFTKAMLVDRDGNKWVACWDYALDRLNDSGPRDTVTHYWPRTYPVAQPDTVRNHSWGWASALDSSGGIWFGMDTGSLGSLNPIGLEYYDAHGAYVANYRLGNSRLRGSLVHGLTVDRRGRIWVGYKGDGIESFPGPPFGSAGPLPIRVSGTDNLIVRGLFAHGDILWALTSGDLRRYGFSGDLEGSYDLPGPPADFAVHPLDVAADGTVWAGTASGIMRVMPDGSTVEYNVSNSPLNNDDIRAIQVDRASGVVWIGTAEGVNRFDPGFVPPTVELPTLRLELYPNPSRITAIGIGLKLAGNASSYRGAIYDLSGRAVRRFVARANGEAIWDGRGPDGAPVKPGIYFVRAEADGRIAVARLVLLR